MLDEIERRIEKKMGITQTKENYIVTLKETVNPRAVKYLNSKPKAWWKEILKTDKDRKFEVEYKKVKAFLSGQLDGTGTIQEPPDVISMPMVRPLAGSSTIRGYRACKRTSVGFCAKIPFPTWT